MTYKRIQPYTKEEAKSIFTQGTSEQVRDALLGITYYVDDWRWVQNACLALLEHPDILVQEIAILCLGHLATFHQTLDLAVVLPALQAHTSHPKLASALRRAFDDIASQVKDTAYFTEHWNNLPQGLKEALIEDEIFDRHGKLLGDSR
jgi:hypothetical protein